MHIYALCDSSSFYTQPLGKFKKPFTTNTNPEERVINMPFDPKRVLFEEDSLNYEMGERLYEHFKGTDVETSILKSHNRVTGIPGKTPQEAYFEGKNTLVVGVRKTLDFQSCKPSAHYQLPLVTGCAGKCEYCYLNTQLGKKPYIRVYVNVDEVLEKAQKYIDERKPEVTFFEASATSDPIPVEPYTGSLLKTINFFGKQEYGRLRFVTKFTDVDTILNAEHNGNTTVRFSINSENVIRRYEHSTPGLDERVDAAFKIADADYHLGFIIAPVIMYDDWERDYEDMLIKLSKKLDRYGEKKIHFEVISHRFTARAKSTIQDIFPKTTLPMQEEERKFKFGQFGYGKYVYNPEELTAMHESFKTIIQRLFNNPEIDYMI